MLRIDPAILPNRYGLRPNQIRAAVRHPTQGPEVLRSPPDDEFRFYAQEVTTTTPRRFVVAIAEEVNGDELVTGVHVVPADLVEPEDTPLKMLQTLAGTFGLPVKLAGRKERFVLSERISKPEDGLLLHPEGPPRHLRYATAIYRLEDDEAFLFLAFVIDVTEVRSYLGLE